MKEANAQPAIQKRSETGMEGRTPASDLMIACPRKIPMNQEKTKRQLGGMPSSVDFRCFSVVATVRPERDPPSSPAARIPGIPGITVGMTQARPKARAKMIAEYIFMDTP